MLSLLLLHQPDELCPLLLPLLLKSADIALQPVEGLLVREHQIAQLARFAAQLLAELMHLRFLLNEFLLLRLQPLVELLNPVFQLLYCFSLFFVLAQRLRSELVLLPGEQGDMRLVVSHQLLLLSLLLFDEAGDLLLYIADVLILLADFLQLCLVLLAGKLDILREKGDLLSFGVAIAFEQLHLPLETELLREQVLYLLLELLDLALQLSVLRQRLLPLLAEALVLESGLLQHLRELHNLTTLPLSQVDDILQLLVDEPKELQFLA